MATRINDLLSQNLQCPICLNVYKEPKLLSCSHTYCKECLSRLFTSQQHRVKLSCPVCRKDTAVPRGDVGNLQVNIPIQGMVDDVQNQSQLCTVCKDKALAATYCQECDDFMCVDCYKTHAKWDKFAGHDVVKVEDIISGKVATKQRRKCKKHRSEVEECFCVECKKYVCFRCGMMEHTKSGHNILEGMEHEDQQREKIHELQSKMGAKRSKVDEYISFIEKQQARLQIIQEQLADEISQTCEESIQQLKERRDVLIEECKSRLNGMTKELQVMKDESKLEMGQIEDVGNLVGNGVKAPLEGEALVAHDTLCQELEKILAKGDPDYSKPKGTTKKGHKVAFQRIRCQQVGQNELDLGNIEEAEWSFLKYIDFPVKDGINCLTSMPDGRIAAGSRFGGLYLISPSGSQSIVLRDVPVRQVVFFPSGNVVIRDIHNTISTYSKTFAKLEVAFKSLSSDAGGFGGLEIDTNNNTILCSYTKAKKLYVFKQTGGKPVNIIQYVFEPHQIFTLRSGRVLVMVDDFTVGVLDATNSTIQNRVTRDGRYASPAVCMDGSFLIAWVDHSNGSVSIEQYSRDLHQIGCLVQAKISIPQHAWYHLREFRSGELGLCSPDQLYIFKKTVSV
ncbi:E3 ubiquitin-protein ligase TRIM45-like [Lytechinus pictus]|uniref:E3 ubiquitin-protein ligase TRIM45-like n=1 Tax=Lytechinus pictus TaxID=7653 RepID=UPI0030BA1242